MNKPPASVSEHGPGLALYECRIRENGWEEPFRYMLLDRLRQDCLYFLGIGNRCGASGQEIFETRLAI